MSMFINYDEKTFMRMYGLAQIILEFIEDRLYRWTPELSNHIRGDVVMTSRKRGMTRPLFYAVVGAGSPLDSVFLKYYNFYTASITGLPKDKITSDHINPPQEFGEFFLDKLHGFFTEKDTSILDIDTIIECLMFTMKKVKISKTLNTALSKFTPSSAKKTPIVVSEKYQFLNENVYPFKNELTLYRDDRLVSEDELQFLFGGCPIDGYVEWQVEKYGAKSYGYFHDDNNKLESTVSLQNIGTLQAFL